MTGTTTSRRAHPRWNGRKESTEIDATPDSGWFEGEVLELLPRLMGAAVRMAGNRADAEDLVAEAVARAWERLGDLRERDRFRGWIFRILTNAFVSRSRRLDARPDTVALPETEEEEAFSLFEQLHQPFLLWWGDSEQVFINRLLREDLERAVDALPDCYRLPVVLADVQGFTYREIAEILEIPVGTVRSRLARARSRLQEALWEHGVDAGLRDSKPQKGSDVP